MPEGDPSSQAQGIMRVVDDEADTVRQYLSSKSITDTREVYKNCRKVQRQGPSSPPAHASKTILIVPFF